VGKHVAFHGQRIITDAELRQDTDPARAFPLEPDSPAFLQFTSGTTSQPKGVLLLHRHVQAQLESYCQALRVSRGDVVVSWLPLYHDLGLVGMVLATLHTGAHLVLLSPVDFLKEPMTWLRALSRHKGVHTAAPNFAFELCVRKCTPELLRAEKIDLASIDNMGMGGEPVSWSTVEKFRAHFAPFGFRGEVLNPCYGLAENTLVATGHRRGEALRSVAVSARGLQENDVREPASEADRAVLVGNGRPFPGIGVRIAGSSGEDLGERKIGEIWVRSPSLAAGSFGDRESTAAVFVERDGERWLRTGDLGFVAAGDLYICGRKKDLLIVHGRNFHPQDLEQEAGRVAGVRAGNVVAFSVDKGAGQGEAAVVVAELDPKAARAVADVRREVTEAIAAAFDLALGDVLLLPSGSIPTTSSGKLQRGLVKEAYARGDLATFAPPGA
jgi:acyl-CoA synthetase (AMP-forming)/AMP-acid ligase II